MKYKYIEFAYKSIYKTDNYSFNIIGETNLVIMKINRRYIIIIIII